MRSRGLKDDTTCVVVDIIPSDNLVLPLIPKKKQSFLSSFFGKKSPSGTNKATSKLSAVGAVEELFEEGSAMLDKRYSHRNMYISAINKISHLDFLLSLSLLLFKILNNQPAPLSHGSEDTLSSYY